MRQRDGRQRIHLAEELRVGHLREGSGADKVLPDRTALLVLEIERLVELVLSLFETSEAVVNEDVRIEVENPVKTYFVAQVFEDKRFTFRTRLLWRSSQRAVELICFRQASLHEP